MPGAGAPGEGAPWAVGKAGEQVSAPQWGDAWVQGCPETQPSWDSRHSWGLPRPQPSGSPQAGLCPLEPGAQRGRNLLKVTQR